MVSDDLADGAQGYPVSDNGPFGRCDKCGAWIEYPPLCPTESCTASWDAYIRTFVETANELPFDDEVEILDEREI